MTSPRTRIDKAGVLLAAGSPLSIATYLIPIRSPKHPPRCSRAQTLDLHTHTHRHGGHHFCDPYVLNGDRPS